MYRLKVDLCSSYLARVSGGICCYGKGRIRATGIGAISVAILALLWMPMKINQWQCK